MIFQECCDASRVLRRFVGSSVGSCRDYSNADASSGASRTALGITWTIIKGRMNYADIAQQIVELETEKSRLQGENAILREQIEFLKKVILSKPPDIEGRDCSGITTKSPG